MKRKLKFEQSFLLLAVLSGLPALVAALVLLWKLELSPLLRWSAPVLLLGLWGIALIALRNQVIRPLQTIANLLAALREEDFSTRASGACAHDALGEVLLEINTLSGLLQEQRLGALEATALLRKVMEEIDLAVFAFDQHQQLKLVNRAGERLLGQPAERLLARSAAELSLAPCLEGEAPRTLQLTFPGGFGRWSLRRSTFWQGGAPHQLLVMADLSRALREEERQAWQRLVRVLGHEINNSLAPIQSISGSLGRLLTKEPLPADWREDMSS
ncbi:MAG TPA: PAS domain-containing protein, partial [Bacillota bacterium]|nr:PAS domain-containing protein [Bacillota bacterium]